MARSLIGFCGLQLCACVLGVAAGLVPGFSYTKSFWGLYCSQIDDNPIRIQTVDPGSPAEEAGFQVGDRISHPGGFRGLFRQLGELRPGDKQRMVVERGGKEFAVEVNGVRPQLAAIWYAHLWYPIAGGIFLVLGLLVFATAPLTPAPLWRSIPLVILGLGLAVGFFIALADASPFSRVRLWYRWPMGSGEEWYFGQGFFGIAAGLLLGVFAAAEVRQRLGSRKGDGQGFRAEPSVIPDQPRQ